jgi:SAM-dependent methyltransferase
MTSFDQQVDEALDAPFEGWDFPFMEGRVDIEPLPWNYERVVSSRASGAFSLVDLGTGGGEFLAALLPRPPLTVATEGWMPNVPVAAARLVPLGVGVVAYAGAPDNAEQAPGSDDGPLPFLDETFDLVIDRHEAFCAKEVFRILKPSGTFLTQQVGGDNEAELNQALGVGPPQASPTIDGYEHQLNAAGFDVVQAREAYSCKQYLDIGAIAYFVKAIPWQFDGIDIAAEREILRPIHETIERYGSFHSHHHRILLEATKP